MKCHFCIACLVLEKMAAIKSALKQARESIQQKDFAKALEICQNEILKVESDNFMGLVFAGKCAYEMAKYADAKIFFHKATQCEPTNLLGWQGLAQIYEKTSELTEESLEASRKLLILLPENDKNRFSHQLKVTKFMLSSGQLDVALVNLNLLKEIASDDKESIAAFHHMVFDCCFKLTLSYSQKDLLQKVLASIEWILNNEASEENYEQSFIFWSKNLPDDQVFHLCDKYKDTFEEAESKMARLAARIYLATGTANLIISHFIGLTKSFRKPDISGWQ